MSFCLGFLCKWSFYVFIVCANSYYKPCAVKFSVVVKLNVSMESLHIFLVVSCRVPLAPLSSSEMTESEIKQHKSDNGDVWQVKHPKESLVWYFDEGSLVR